MDAALNDEDIPLFSRQLGDDGKEVLMFLGFYPGHELRTMISRRQANFSREPGTGRRRVILSESAPELLKARALSAAGATQALSTTYTENLYPDPPAQLAYKKENGIEPTVTATLMTMKKYRGKNVGFVPYSPTETFKRKRFNPDLLQPLHWSARAAEKAILGR